MKQMVAASPDKLNPTDLLNLTTVWTLNPSLVATISESPENFVQEEWIALTDPLLAVNRWGDAEARKSQRKSFFDARLGKLRETGEGTLILRLLAAMFPHVGEWHERRGGSISREEYEQSLRIAHPRFFTRYLTMVVPGSQFAEADFDKLVSRLQGKTEDEVFSEITSLVNTIEPKSLKCMDFLRLLGSALDKLSRPALMGIVNSLTQLASDMEEGMLGIGTRAQARSIIFGICKQNERRAARTGDLAACNRVHARRSIRCPDSVFVYS